MSDNTDEFRRNLLFKLPLLTGSTGIDVVMSEEERIKTADGGEKHTQSAKLTFTTTMKILRTVWLLCSDCGYLFYSFTSLLLVRKVTHHR